MLKKNDEYYKALVARNTEYEGIFFYALDTTRTFCRPTCPSRKPKIENCKFFKTAKEASSSKYRPCLRCNPTLPPKGVSDLVETLLIELEDNPDKQWDEKDFAKLGVNPITVRRQFKKRFGMTFVEYARMHRLELALNLIKSGQSIIDAQVSLGYESSSGLREAFYRLFGAAPSKLKNVNILKASLIDTPFGPLKAIADEKTLYFLDFVDSKDLDSKVEEVKLTTKSFIFPGMSPPILSIEKELARYFEGRSKTFITPLWLEGSSVHKSVYDQVQKIPFGEIRIYSDMDCEHQAILKAIKANRFAIVVPFHRLLSDKKWISRNQWLINHEQVACRRNLF